MVKTRFPASVRHYFDDAVSETLLACAEARATWDGVRSFRAWRAAKAHFAVKEFLRKVSRWENPPVRGTPPPATGGRRRNAARDAVILQLSKTGLSAAKIGKQLGVSKSQVARAIRRAA